MWKVTKAEVSTRGLLRVEGVNLETTDPLYRSFIWETNKYGVRDGRYDFSDCVFAPGARELLERMMR